ncbi:MarR family transcriptional regulator [Streptomyces lincolnensis]|uniref:MarR family winged helix-turn-helix transcriptional regulator n=1 Tax=Streptomyces lincolnensis TaxID=1915 RepID=UPI001E32778F|nr:MarR family transcriptional regulator [Streptomyces lincolnensis]MCD7443044.1 MarR family transcriptional regulator [Streptomyces lincolnensis]
MADHPACPATSADGLLPAELHAWMLMLASTHAVEQELHSVVKERLGVSHDEFLILCLLAGQPDTGLRMTRIAELLGRPKTRLTYQIACLQHAGLISRQSVCGDKRGVEVTLTDKARQLLKEHSEFFASTVKQELVRFMGPAQCAAMRALMSTVVEESGEPAGAGEPARSVAE